jgi:hypothetical protein
METRRSSIFDTLLQGPASGAVRPVPTRFPNDRGGPASRRNSDKNSKLNFVFRFEIQKLLSHAQVRRGKAHNREGKRCSARSSEPCRTVLSRLVA